MIKVFQKKVTNEYVRFSFAMSQADFFWTTLASINAKSAMNFSVTTSFCFSLIDCIKFSFVSIILFFFSDYMKDNNRKKKMVHKDYHLFFHLPPMVKETLLLLKSSHFVHFSLLNLSLVNLFYYFCPSVLKITNT